MSLSLSSAEHDQTRLTARLPQWRTRLLQERAFRTEQLTALNAQITTSPELAYDDVVRTLLAGAAATLGAVNDALCRMDHGRYGFCQECGTAISPGRLEVLPMAALCMTCQQQGRSSAYRDEDAALTIRQK